jgi:hypothetical protein
LETLRHLPGEFWIGLGNLVSHTLGFVASPRLSHPVFNPV